MSKKALAIRVLLLSLLFCVAVFAADGTDQLASNAAAEAVRRRVDQLLSTVPQGTSIGLMVVDCESGATWCAVQPRLPLKPASVMKLFVTAAALEHFGPGFGFQTRVYLDDDELLILGGGDPGLGDDRLASRHDRPTHEEFDLWAQALSKRGVTALRTIAIDDCIFDQQLRHPDWSDDQAQKWYQAPVCGINFNDNCLDAGFTVTAGRVALRLQPDLPDCFFTNRLKVGSKHKPIVRRPIDQDVFQFSGSVARSDRFGPVSVHHPTVFFGYALRRALEKRGVRLRGEVVRRRLTPEALSGAELLDVRTTPLSDVLWRCNTFSQNLFAECLLKSLAAYNADGSRTGEPGSWTGGLPVLRAALQRLGLDLDGALFRDGSGLSHGNRVTAEHVVRLLLAIRRHPHFEVFSNSLAEAGQVGTLRRQYAGQVLRGCLRGKTGTIRGVRALAGYVERADGHTLAFALLVNGKVPRPFRVQIAEALAAAGVETKP